MSQTKAELINGLSVNTALDDAATIDSSGNVGIGTTSPATILHVKANVGDMLRLDRDNSGAVGNQIAFRHKDGSNNLVETSSINAVASSNGADGNLRFSTKTNGGSNTEKMRIDSDGDLLVGLTSALSAQTGSIQAAGSILSKSFINAHTSNAAVLQYQSNVASIRAYGATSGSGILTFTSGGGGDATDTERVRITNTGNIFMGESVNSSGLVNSRGYIFETSGTMQIVVSTTGDKNVLEIGNPNGNVGRIQAHANSTSYLTTSDYRLKENVVPISDGITRLKTLKPYKFNFKADPSTTVDGFFAHEVTAVPEAISGTKDEVALADDEVKKIKKGDPMYQGIDQSKLVPLLTAALQEEIAKREALESRVATLEAA